MVSVINISADKYFTKIIDILGQIEENSVNSEGIRVCADISKEVIFVFQRFQKCLFEFYFVLWLTNAQLSHKLTHCYMLQHYRVIVRELLINVLPSYTSISNAAVGNTVYNYDVSHRLYASSHTIVTEISILKNH